MTANYLVYTDKGARVPRTSDACSPASWGTFFTLNDNGRDPQKLAKVQGVEVDDESVASESASGELKYPMRFSNREPVFREDLGAYCLDFGGRVSMASVKNFQLISSEDQ
ncbi:hypothetical protein BBJ28_00017465 [Nothophytophthora sp. Chile5]|nr:hypothetical protein BBJ28_00017465 [Nothophytophthora sp. Chile5]